VWQSDRNAYDAILGNGPPPVSGTLWGGIGMLGLTGPRAYGFGGVRETAVDTVALVPAIEDRLSAMGLELPALFAAPAGLEIKFDLVRVVDGYAHISGHGPMDGSRPLMQGKVGDGLSLDEGYEAARLTALSMLASLKQELGDLDRVKAWVRALGLVNCAPGFNRTPGVINGFSDLVLELWGDSGRHARSAIGVAELPFDLPVEVEATVQTA
jgi:enamine deaminase RidA (YjgF/YER057c/UK114 family)